MVNYYEALGLDSSLQGDTLLQELTKIQRTWQSRTNAPSLEKRQEAENLLKLAIEAKELFSNPKEKEKYDKKLSRQRQGADREEKFSTSENLGDLLVQIGELISSNNISNALILSKRAALVAPNDHRVVSYLGYCYWRMGQLNDAIREYETAIALNPQSLEYYYDLIFIHLDNDNTNAAENYLNMVLKMEPDNMSFVRIQTLLNNRKGLYNETIEFVESYLADRTISLSTDEEREIIADLVDAYEAKAFEHYDMGSDGNYYLTDLDKLDKVKAIWEKISQYKSIYNDPRYVDKQIAKLDSLYEKKFRPGAKSLFIVPGIIVALGFFGKIPSLMFLGIALIGGIIFIGTEPQWKVNRSLVLGQKTPLDHVISVNKILLKGLGLILIIFKISFKILDSMANSNTKNY